MESHRSAKKLWVRQELLTSCGQLEAPDSQPNLRGRRHCPWPALLGDLEHESRIPPQLCGGVEDCLRCGHRELCWRPQSESEWRRHSAGLPPSRACDPLAAAARQTVGPRPASSRPQGAAQQHRSSSAEMRASKSTKKSSRMLSGASCSEKGRPATPDITTDLKAWAGPALCTLKSCQAASLPCRLLIRDWQEAEGERSLSAGEDTAEKLTVTQAGVVVHKISLSPLQGLEQVTGMDRLPSCPFHAGLRQH